MQGKQTQQCSKFQKVHFQGASLGWRGTGSSAPTASAQAPKLPEKQSKPTLKNEFQGSRGMQCLLRGMKIRCCLFCWVHINFPPCLHSSTGHKSISKEKSTVCFAISPCKRLFSVQADFSLRRCDSAEENGAPVPLPAPSHSTRNAKASLELGGHLYFASRTTHVFPWQPLNLQGK